MSTLTTPQILFGMQVVVSPDKPKMKLSPECPVTPDMRVETDAWLLRFFGTHNLIKDGDVLKVNGHLLMNPRTYQLLKAEVKEHLCPSI